MRWLMVLLRYLLERRWRYRDDDPRLARIARAHELQQDFREPSDRRD